MTAAAAGHHNHRGHRRTCQCAYDRDVELRARRCAGPERRREAEVETGIDEGEPIAVPRHGRGHLEQWALDHRRDRAARQIGAQRYADERVGEVLDDPQSPALQQQPVERARHETGDVERRARTRSGIDREQLTEVCVAHDQRRAVRRCVDPVEVERAGNERSRRTGEDDRAARAQGAVRVDRDLVQDRGERIREVRGVTGHDDVVQERSTARGELVGRNACAGARVVHICRASGAAGDEQQMMRLVNPESERGASRRGVDEDGPGAGSQIAAVDVARSDRAHVEDRARSDGDAFRLEVDGQRYGIWVSAGTRRCRRRHARDGDERAGSGSPEVRRPSPDPAAADRSQHSVTSGPGCETTHAPRVDRSATAAIHHCDSSASSQ